MIKIGDTYLLSQRGINDHLQVVISYPELNPDKIVLVSLTSYDKPEDRELKDSSCVLHPADHPWITHETCVSYRDGRVARREDLDRLLAREMLRQSTPVSQVVLKRILEGAERTEELPNKCKEVLLGQALIAE